MQICVQIIRVVGLQKKLRRQITTNTKNRGNLKALPTKNVKANKKLHGVNTPPHLMHPKSRKNSINKKIIDKNSD